MATLSELRTLFGDGDMIQLVESSIIKKCAAILGEQTPSATRKDFALESLQNPQRYSASLWRYLLGANAAETVDDLTRATGPTTPDDATIQTAVDTAIDALWP